LRKKKTRQWVIVRSGSASTALKFLRHSFGQSTVPSYYGTIAIMFPMIISVNEVKKIKEIIAEVKAGLDADGIPYKDVELGYYDRDTGGSYDQ